MAAKAEELERVKDTEMGRHCRRPQSVTASKTASARRTVHFHFRSAGPLDSDVILQAHAQQPYQHQYVVSFELLISSSDSAEAALGGAGRVRYTGRGTS
jgi:hypothetical protein